MHIFIQVQSLNYLSFIEPISKPLEQKICSQVDSLISRSTTIIWKKSPVSRKNCTFSRNHIMGWFLDGFRLFTPKTTSLATFFEVLLQKQISHFSRNFCTFMLRNLCTFLHLEVILSSNDTLRVLSCLLDHMCQKCGSTKKRCLNALLATKNAQIWKKVFLICYWCVFGGGDEKL